MIKWGWQTYAWSGGNWDKRAQLQQYSNDRTVGGVSVDYDRSTVDFFGQWTKTAPVPTPSPTFEGSMATELVLSNADGRLEVWAVDQATKHPAHRWVQAADGKWSSWVTKACPREIVELAGGKHPDGHLEVFAKAGDGGIYHNWQAGPNGLWQDAFIPF